MLKPKRSITVELLRSPIGTDPQYLIAKTVNTVSPVVGKILTMLQVDALITGGATVTIIRSKPH